MIPVVVLTGALGAGKTTLLNTALRSGAIRNAGVVVNEFGAAGIDNALIESSSEDVVLLPGGCVCCEVRADLAEALLRLERSARRGEIAPIERIVVETSGLAEPGPILQLFVESPALAGRFRLDALVTVFDAQLGPAELAEGGTAFRQALLADRLIVTKWESAATGSLDSLEIRLAGLAPHAERLRAPRGTADAAWFGPAREAAVNANESTLRHAAHDEAIESFVIRWSDRHPLAAIGTWLHGLADSYGARLLRVKGIVSVAEEARPVAVHAIRHLVAAPDFIHGTAGTSRVVFITRGLEAGDVLPPWPIAVDTRSGAGPRRAGTASSGWTAASR